MKNKKGFTLVELMIVIGIAAILAVISIPSVMKWYKKDKFIQQTREIIDMINDARTNAITEKKCSDGSSSDSWTWYIHENTVSLACSSSGSFEIEKDLFFDSNIMFSGDEFFFMENDSVWEGSLNSYKVLVSFYSGNNKSHIAMEDNLNHERYSIKSIKIPLEFPEDSTIKRTICFDRIAGFPTMSLTEECDD